MAYYSTNSGKSFCFANFPSGTSGEGEAWIPSQKMKRSKSTKQSQSQLMHECCECTIKNTCSKFLEGKSLLMSYALSLEL